MLTVFDLMSRTLVTVSPGTTLREALMLLAEHRVSGAPVVSRGRVVGVVSATDLLAVENNAFAAAEADGAALPNEAHQVTGFWVAADESAVAYLGEAWADPWSEPTGRLASGRDTLSRHTVAEVMSRPICWVPPELPVRDAAAYMTNAGVHRVLVLDGDRLVGVLSTVDIVRAVGNGLTL